MFWLLALLITSAAGLLVLWPLLTGHSRWKSTGLLVLLLIPGMIYWQYQLVGTPAALSGIQPAESVAIPADTNLEDLVATLQEKLSQSAADLEGWVLLGRSYKTLQNYPAALEALETANRLVPNTPVVLVELVEARLFASGNPKLNDEMVALLEQAVAMEPGLQKAWWLLGIAAAQNGNDPLAIDYWQKLLQGMDPGSAVAVSVQEQISEAESRLGLAGSQMPAIPAIEETFDSWNSPVITITTSDEASNALASLPSTAALFLIVRAAGENTGPPLGVRRIEIFNFPFQLTLSDQDSMIPQRPISSATELQLQARISMTGQAMPESRDWQSRPIIFGRDSGVAVSILIDQVVE